MTAIERVAIKRAHRLHPEWTADDIRAYGVRWKMLDPCRTEAEVRAVVDSMSTTNGRLL